jgi:hypothetical protein
MVKAMRELTLNDIPEHVLEDAVADVVVEELQERFEAKALREWFEAEFLGTDVLTWYGSQQGKTVGEDRNLRLSEEELVKLSVAPVAFYLLAVQLGNKTDGEKLLALTDEIETELKMPALLAMHLFRNMGVRRAE